jgi:ATP adenylyltransferase/5',5'''-P-1,P-4-tetraphosphate phosphorylase II
MIVPNDERVSSTNHGKSTPPPGTLWPAMLRRAGHALRCGALQPIETVQAVIESGGIRFVVRQDLR